MSETTLDQPVITPEMIAAYQRQQAVKEEQARHQVLQELIALAAERGYKIVAMPLIDGQGRIIADWGVTATK